MRKVLVLAGIAALGGCQQKIAVPTAQELANNPSLLAEWRSKCDTGEYSHLEAAQKANICTTTDQATATVAMRKSSKADTDFFNAMSKRK